MTFYINNFVYFKKLRILVNNFIFPQNLSSLRLVAALLNDMLLRLFKYILVCPCFFTPRFLNLVENFIQMINLKCLASFHWLSLVFAPTTSLRCLASRHLAGLVFLAPRFRSAGNFAPTTSSRCSASRHLAGLVLYKLFFIKKLFIQEGLWNS